MGTRAGEGRGTLPVGVDAGRPGSRAAAERGPTAAQSKAYQAVDKAIRAGTLKTQNCEVCGEWANAHHDDYSRPLEVRWLCPRHHREWHGANAGEGNNRSKLKQAQVDEIRKRYGSSRGLTLAQIGEFYGVSATAIASILSGKAWRRGSTRFRFGAERD